MESDSKQGKNAEQGNKNSKRGMKSGELPSNLKPKFPAEKGKDEEKDLMDGDKESEENAHHSLSPAAEPKSACPLKPVKTEEKLAKLKRSDYAPQPIPKSADTDKEGEEPAHHSPSEPSPLKMVKTAEKLKLPEKSNEKPEKNPAEKTAEKMEKTGDKDKNAIPLVPSKPILSKDQALPKKKPSLEDANSVDQLIDKGKKPPAMKPQGPTGAPSPKENEVANKSQYLPIGKTPSTNTMTEAKSVEQKTKKTKTADQKSKQQVNLQPNRTGFFKQIRMKLQATAAKTAEIEAKTIATPEQMAKPYVPAEYAFHRTSNDYKPNPFYFQRGRVQIPSGAALNYCGEKGVMFLNNRPFWLTQTMINLKNPPRRIKIQIHKKVKMAHDGGIKDAIAPPQDHRDTFADPMSANIDTLRNKSVEKKFTEKQMASNTFYATLYFETEKTRLEKEPKPKEKKAPERVVKFKFLDEKGGTVVSEHPPVNVPSVLYAYDRKDRPGISFPCPETRQFTICETRIEGRKPVKKVGSSTTVSSAESNSRSDSKKT